MPIQGLSHADHFNTPTGRRPQNWREGIQRLGLVGGRISQAPLTQLTAAMRSAATDDPIYNWFEKPTQTRRLRVTTALTNVATTVVFSGGNATSLYPGLLLFSEQTNEVMRVASITSDTQIEVTRGFAGSTATAIAISNAENPHLIVIGSAFEENSVAPSPVGFDPTTEFNYCQIFRGTYGLSNTATKTNTRTGDEQAEQKRDCLENFTMDMERAFFFGRRSLSTVNGRPLRTTGGIIPAIQALSNVLAAPGNNLSMATLESWSEQIFAFGSEEKMAFTGTRFITAINTLIRKNSQANFSLGPVVKEYGMNVRRLELPHGVLVLKQHPLFAVQGQIPSATWVGMTGAAVVLDMADIRYRYLTGRDVTHQKDMETPGQDGKLMGFIAECGMELTHGRKHFMLTNVNAGVLDT
jgi:hypothetical protein